MSTKSHLTSRADGERHRKVRLDMIIDDINLELALLVDELFQISEIRAGRSSSPDTHAPADYVDRAEIPMPPWSLATVIHNIVEVGYQQRSGAATRPHS